MLLLSNFSESYDKVIYLLRNSSLSFYDETYTLSIVPDDESETECSLFPPSKISVFSLVFNIVLCPFSLGVPFKEVLLALKID